MKKQLFNGYVVDSLGNFIVLLVAALTITGMAIAGTIMSFQMSTIPKNLTQITFEATGYEIGSE